MNLIPELDITEEDKLYFYLLSNAETDGSDIISKYRRRHLNRKFSDPTRLLGNLEAAGKIESLNGKYIVGQKELGGKCVLLQNRSKIDWISKLEPFNKKVGRKDFSSIFYDCEDIYQNADMITVRELARFYTNCYELVHQVPHRKFNKKEYGQLKTALSSFSAKDLCDMMIEYFINGSAYYKSPSLGLFLYHKDTLYNKVHAINVREAVRKHVEDEDF